MLVGGMGSRYRSKRVYESDGTIKRRMRNFNLDSEDWLEPITYENPPARWSGQTLFMKM